MSRFLVLAAVLFAGVHKAAAFRLKASSEEALRARSFANSSSREKVLSMEKVLVKKATAPAPPPQKWGQGCFLWDPPCAAGLSCQPGVLKCYNNPRKYLEPCVAGHSCGAGLGCVAFEHVCKCSNDAGCPHGTVCTLPSGMCKQCSVANSKYCIGATPVCKSSESRCIAPLANGATCTYGSECKSKACPFDSLFGPKYCRECDLNDALYSSKIKEQCAVSAPHLSNPTCSDSNKCVDKNAVQAGSPCHKTGQCSFAQTCWQQKCRTRASRGGQCGGIGNADCEYGLTCCGSKCWDVRYKGADYSQLRAEKRGNGYTSFIVDKNNKFNLGTCKQVQRG